MWRIAFQPSGPASRTVSVQDQVEIRIDPRRHAGQAPASSRPSARRSRGRRSGCRAAARRGRRSARRRSRRASGSQTSRRCDDGAGRIRPRIGMRLELGLAHHAGRLDAEGDELHRLALGGEAVQLACASAKPSASASQRRRRRSRRRAARRAARSSARRSACRRCA